MSNHAHNHPIISRMRPATEVQIPPTLGGIGAWNPAEGLTSDELVTATNVARRLRAELLILFNALPTSARTGVGLARHLGIDRGTGTRFANVCRKPIAELEVLRQLPGIKGLEQVLDAMAARSYDRAAIDAARVAVAQFESFIQDHGGSQTRLSEKIAAVEAGLDSEDEDAAERRRIEHRRTLFEGAVATLGQRALLRTNIMVFRPTPGSDRKMDQAMLRGIFGYQARPDAPPYVLRTFGRNDDVAGELIGQVAYTTLDGKEARGLTGGTVLEEFTSKPVPLVTARGGGRESLLTIDPDRSASGTPQDIVIAHEMIGEWLQPIHDTPPTHEVSSFLRSPSAALILDVFLHRSMAARCLPALKVYQSSPGLFEALSDHWYDQLPHPPRLQLLGADPQNLPSRLHPRHAEITRTFFDRLDWNLADFVGYRCEVEYPLWSGFYCIIFDYAAARDDE